MAHVTNTCYYHGDDCLDGLAAAWVVSEYHRTNGKREPKFIPVNYHTVISGFPTGVVTLVDFIFTDIDVMRKLIDTAKSVMVIDHHPQARELIDTLQNEYPSEKFIGFWDDRRSGAGLTWDLLMKGPRPPLIDHIEDRDLWTFNLPNTEDFCNGLNRWPKTFTSLSRAVKPEHYGHLLSSGREYRKELDAVWEIHWKDLNDTYAKPPMIELSGLEIPVMPIERPELRSELAQRFIDELNVPIVALIWPVGNHTRVRLVSKTEGPDVNKIAKKWGGGGHPHASGMMLNDITPEDLLL